MALGAAMLASASASAAGPSPACGDLMRAVPIVDGGAIFLPSYPTAEPGPLRNVAFLYDNAVAAIALVGCGDAAAARRIGDAIVWALDHDRFWRDGRLRNAYAAGPVRDSPAKLGGWWDAKQNRWLEDAYQVGSDSGNMAWAMLALLVMDRALQDDRYRAAASRIGDWVAGAADGRGAGGFTGGVFGWEPDPARVKWKSTEHNTDIAAAFSLLAQATGEAAWSDRGARAGRFVTAMWDAARGCYAVGTTEDGVTPNPIVAIDAQLWPLLAIPEESAAHEGAVFVTLDQSLKAGGGYSYSDAATGLWTEGTAQAAVVAGLLGRAGLESSLNAAIEAERSPSGLYYATAAASLGTGFVDPSSPGVERVYYHLPHLAATAWAALAEKSYNPFLGTAKLP